MGIVHAAGKASGERGFAAEWNADHAQTSDHDAGGFKITNLADPAAAQDAATKAYADSKAPEDVFSGLTAGDWTHDANSTIALALERANDGDSDTEGQITKTSSEPETIWVTADLGEVVQEKLLTYKIAFSTAAGSAGNVLKLQHSTDNLIWTDIFSYTVGAGTFTYSDTAIIPKLRYLRICHAAAGWSGIVKTWTISCFWVKTH